tara:strand:- start:180 stop:491 length:312 start_codon:yes stop_codon:yes gene_type:complete
MASGTLGQSAPAATTNTTVYTVPVGTTAIFNVNIVNRGTTAATVRLAIAATGTPSNSEYLEYDASIPASGVLERSGLMATAGKLLVAYASTANTSVNIYGYEE